ncbi:MAG: enoyl-CoA hydratase [Gammaproteobacteria bacterium]|nr:MAG: enoyl-CoA hydratase [Gammaproteobacteria bacterium]
MQDRISIEIENGIADVRMIRADKMNALDDAMLQALAETADQLKQDKSVRVVVLSGEGKAFCAGLDMGNFAKLVEQPDADGLGDLMARTHGVSNLFQYVSYAWRELPVPVIAALHGVAFGGGFQIALGADIRYAAPETRFSIMEIKWGLVPDMAGTQLMRHLASDDIVRELCYTGRVFEADDARSYGFVTHVVANPRAEAMALAAQIARRSPDAVAANKRLLNAAPYLSVAEGFLMESQEQKDVIGKPNQLEAVMSELEQRAPNYQT